jgi:hypothetical protein
MMKNLEIIDKEIVCDDAIFENIENNGYYESNDWVLFKIDDNRELLVNYIVSLSGTVDIDNGDYWTPPSSDITISNVDLNFESIFIDEEEIDINYFSDNYLKELKSIILDFY